MRVSVDQAVASVQRCTRRFTDLVRTGLDADQPVVGLAWTVHELVAHVASGSVAYRQIAESGASVYASLDERAAVNQARLDRVLAADLVTLADTIDAEIGRLLAAVQTLPAGDELAWHGGIRLAVTPFLGAAVGELLLHGLDLARTAKAPWPLDRRDGVVAVEFFDAVTPHVVDGARAGSLTATFEVRYRGYATTTFSFRDGALTVTPGASRRADVRLAVDPVAFLLVGYRRASLARAIASGRALAWGRRPWLALRFPSLFQPP